MSTEVAIALCGFCLHCIGLAISVPVILIVVEACIKWASAANTDSFLDNIKSAAEAFWDAVWA